MATRFSAGSLQRINRSDDGKQDEHRSAKHYMMRVVSEQCRNFSKPREESIQHTPAFLAVGVAALNARVVDIC
jgi:hypothetical protein